MMYLVMSVIIIGFLITRFEFIVAEGKSMQPTIHSGDIVLIYKPLFRHSLKHRGVYVVDIKLENYSQLVIKRLTRVRTTNDGEKVIWIVGDNLRESYDSRAYGYVSQKFIVGRVLKIWKTNKRKWKQI